MLLEARLMLRERPLHRTRSARSSAPLSRSRSDTRTPLPCNPQTTPAYPGWLYSGTTQVMQATLGDEVVLIPPGVSRTLVPLDCPLAFDVYLSGGTDQYLRIITHVLYSVRPPTAVLAILWLALPSLS